MTILSMHNALLSSLSQNTYKNILAVSKQIELSLSEVIQQPESKIRHVYFPLTGFISLMTPINDSAYLEVGMVGNE